MSKVNKTNTVKNIAIAYLSPSTVSTDFFKSCAELYLHRSNVVNGQIDVRCGGGITRGRNVAVAKFLTQGDEWLLFVDSDMSFTVKDFDAIVAAADAKERPVVGGLCFGQEGMAGPFSAIFPTIFDLHDAGGYMPRWDYEKDAVLKCDATGAAFLLVHRSVFLKIRELHDDGDFSWFHEYVHPEAKLWVSEDVAFCERVREAGFPIHVATSAKILHHKGINYALSEPMFDIIKAARVNA
jgi:hypothetical protein